MQAFPIILHSQSNLFSDFVFQMKENVAFFQLKVEKKYKQSTTCCWLGNENQWSTHTTLSTPPLPL